MKRNRGGERDLDHIIMAASRGLDRASLEYPQVRAGIILMMDRTFDERQNEIIVEKAIRYAWRGVVGVDIAGPASGAGPVPVPRPRPLIQAAREAGLGVTMHVGEEGWATRWARSSRARARIGSATASSRPGSRADRAARRARDGAGDLPDLEPADEGAADADAVRDTFRAFLEAGVRVTVSTDGPEMMRTHLRDEFAFLCRIDALSEDEARAANALAHASSFVRTPAHVA